MKEAEIVVIGGGAAGMMAAITASENGARVLLLEKNEKTGKKLYITGKGRCNVTNACEHDAFFRQIVKNPKFLYGAYTRFDNAAVMAFFEEAGTPLKIERGERVFPVSDKASDILKTLNRKLEKNGVEVALSCTVHAIEPLDRSSDENKARFLVRYTDEKGKAAEASAQCVILATGGITYPSTGSTGDGHRFAKELGHSVSDLYPALVPFTVLEEDAALMQGLSLRNVAFTLKKEPGDKKPLYEGFGELLFTHFGLSGPLVLSASSLYAKHCAGKEAYAVLDWKPALSKEQLDRRLLRDFEAEPKKQLNNALGKLLPAKSIPVFLRRSGLNPEKRVGQLQRTERQVLIDLCKAFPFTVIGTRGENEAIITQGGVSVREVNPSTMESRLQPGLYFAGELLDADALTGGYNLQIAWSTGYLAGTSAAIAAQENREEGTKENGLSDCH